MLPEPELVPAQAAVAVAVARAAQAAAATAAAQVVVDSRPPSVVVAVVAAVPGPPAARSLLAPMAAPWQRRVATDRLRSPIHDENFAGERLTAADSRPLKAYDSHCVPLGNGRSMEGLQGAASGQGFHRRQPFTGDGPVRSRCKNLGNSSANSDWSVSAASSSKPSVGTYSFLENAKTNTLPSDSTGTRSTRPRQPHAAARGGRHSARALLSDSSPVHHQAPARERPLHKSCMRQGTALCRCDRTRRSEERRRSSRPVEQTRRRHHE